MLTGESADAGGVEMSDEAGKGGVIYNGGLAEGARKDTVLVHVACFMVASGFS